MLSKIRYKYKLSENKRSNLIHILIIIIGIIFINLSIFHKNVWFDECYSIGISKFSFLDIWNIGANDVHPILYYWILHIIGICSNYSILSYRLFSGVSISILGILGYTHIRKDFGKRVGILFSFLVYFMPVTVIFTNQIRMYAFLALTITITCIYAYRIGKEKLNSTCNKNWIIFSLFCVFSIYSHYYGLITACVINIILLYYLIKNKRKKDIIKLVLLDILQLILYLPWCICFIKQITNVSKGFWIGFIFPDTIIELISFIFIGNLNYYVGFIISIIIYSYLGYLIYKFKKNKTIINNKKNINININQNNNIINSIKSNNNLLPIKLSIGIILSVIFIALVATCILQTSVIYYRYLFILIGLYIFILSYLLSLEKNKGNIIFICMVILILSVTNNIKQIKNNYDLSNKLPIEYLKDNIQDNDIIVYSNDSNGFIMSSFFNNKEYFYDKEYLNTKEAYKAFGKNFNTVYDLNFLDNYKGRIWIIDNLDKDLYNSNFNNNTVYNLISERYFKTKYQDNDFNILLINKINKLSN